MKIYDISVPIFEGMHAWPRDPKVKIRPNRQISKGSSCNVSRISFGSHTGTHVDAPYHFLKKGKKMDEIPLGIFIGKAWVFEIDAEKKINIKDINKLNLEGKERVLFKTTNSKIWERRKKFFKEFVYITDKAAKFIVEAGVKLLGIDYLSVEGFGIPGAPAHHILLGNGVILLEGINLLKVSQGEYELICMPLKISGGDGAPARVILREIN